MALDRLRDWFAIPAPDRLDDPRLRHTTTLTPGPHRNHSATVTASAARVVPANAQALRSSRQKWQADAWVYRDAVPEVRYAHNFLGNAAAQVRMLPAELARDGEDPIEFDSDLCTLPPALRADAQDALDRLTGNAAGHGAILAPTVQNFETVGECWLVGFTDPDTFREDWSIRSMDELKISDEGYRLMDSPGSTTGRDLPDDTYAVRLWSPHPRFGAWPDSPMRPLLDTCEELLLAGRSRRAGLRSRIAGNGILKIPNGLLLSSTAAPTTDSGNLSPEDPEARRSKFMADLTLSMVTPIGDEQSVAGTVPLGVTGDIEDLKGLDHLTLDRPMTKDADEAEAKALRRLATGLDVPPEIITGLADVNHWTAWQIDQATWTHHVEPIVAASCAALTVGYLRATLLAMGYGWPLVSRVVLWYDPANLVADPRAAEEVGDTGRTPAELKTLFDTAAGAIRAGFDPAEVLDALDLPKIKHLGLLPITVQAPEEEPPLQVESSRAEGPPPEEEPPAEEPPPAARAAAALQRLGIAHSNGHRPRTVVAAADTAEPTPEQVRLSRRLMDTDRALRERLVGACDAALARVLERAGNRARTAATRSTTAASHRDRIAGLPGQQVCATLGRPVVAALGLDEAELLADEYARLRGQYTEWTTAASQDAIDTCVRLLGADANTEQIRRLAGELQQAFREGIEAGWEFLQTGLADVAEAHLYRPDPDAPAVGEVAEALVNPSLVRGALATAGGLHTAIGGLTRDGLPGARNRGVGGIGTGELLSDFMRGQGAGIDHYEWSYGISSRTFEPHRNLDGKTFETWGVPELSTAGTGAEWIGESFAPGDHKGCHCDYLPVWSDGVRQADVLAEVGDVAGGRAADLAAGRNVPEGPRRRAVAATVPYRGEDAPPKQPVPKDPKVKTRTRKPAKDEAGVPYRLTYSYLSKLTTEQLDQLSDHIGDRIGSGDPRELARLDALGQWEDYEAGETAAILEAGEFGDARRAADDFAARNAVPGLTHNRVGGRPHTGALFDEETGVTRAQVQEEYVLWVEEQFVALDEVTRGSGIVNPRGERRGLTAQYLITTSRMDDVYRYATEETLAYWETHPRMTWTEYAFARTGNPALAERAAKHARENASINRDRQGGPGRR